MKLLIVLMVCICVRLEGQTATAPSAGNGTTETPYQIATLENLYWIAEQSSRWGYAYEQTANIDASATSSWFSGAGWIPIGNGTTQFTGRYDGKGYSISSLFVNRTTGIEVGLFGYTNRAIISNLGVINAAITGTGTAGALIGYKLYGSVVSCYSSGSITVTPDYKPAGGLVGTNARPYPYSYPSTISESYSTATVHGNRYAGGFVGFNEHNIDRCYSTGNVTGTVIVGGFVGYHYGGEIRDSYSRGNVTGSSEVGGFFGTIYVGGVYCYSSYSTGTVSGSSSTGGFGGNGSGGTAYYSFWDVTSSGKATSLFATGKTTSEMKTVSTFTDAGWDFETETVNGTNNYWDIDLGGVYNDGYPFLSWQNGAIISMPVELTSFSAAAIGRNIKLQWSTATETNNHGFEVERKELNHRLIDPIDQSTNGSMSQWTNGPMDQWLHIAFVEGYGSSNTPHEYRYTDRMVNAGTYAYRLKQIDRDGAFHYTETIEVLVNAKPASFVLEQNYPNPFNPKTAVRYQVSEFGLTSLVIFDMIGREAAVLVKKEQEPGSYVVPFDGTHCSSGIYIARLTSNGKTLQRTMLLVK